MRNRELRAAVRELVEAAGALLKQALDAGDELPFELEESGGSGAVLYRYRALTGEFVARHWPQVRALDAYSRARGALGSGAGPYLRHRGLPGSDADDALRDLVARLFEDATGFELAEERFERVYAELDATLAGSTVGTIVIAPLHGVRIASARVQLADGLALARRGAIDSPPAELEGSPRPAESTTAIDPATDAEAPSPLEVFCLLERELPLDSALPVDEARVVFRRLLTSLRLCGAGGTALGPLAWARAELGAWHPVALGVSARARPESWELHSAEETELRELLEIVQRSRHSATVGWALARFEMGCDRALETEALSDYLLGLRALLGEPGAPGDAAVARRLPVLCSAPERRSDARARIERAFALEQQLVLGAGGSAALDSPRGLVRDVERDLRALLRDVLCGYLDEDLRALADDLLRGPAPPDDAGAELRVRDTRTADEDTQELAPVVPGAVEAGAVTASIDWDTV